METTKNVHNFLVDDLAVSNIPKDSNIQRVYHIIVGEIPAG